MLNKMTLELADKLGKETSSNWTLISLYIPAAKQVSDVMNTLRDEYGTASNIKDVNVRKEVMMIISKVATTLKIFKDKMPPNGLAIFASKDNLYVFTGYQPITIYLYRADKTFHITHLLKDHLNKCFDEIMEGETTVE